VTYNENRRWCWVWVKTLKPQRIPEPKLKGWWPRALEHHYTCVNFNHKYNGAQVP